MLVETRVFFKPNAPALVDRKGSPGGAGEFWRPFRYYLVFVNNDLVNTAFRVDAWESLQPHKCFRHRL